MFVQEIRKSLARVLKEIGIEVEEKDIVVEHPARTEHGDYASNVALLLGNKLKIQNEKFKIKEIGSPLEIAELIAQKIKSEKYEIPNTKYQIPIMKLIY